MYFIFIESDQVTVDSRPSNDVQSENSMRGDSQGNLHIIILRKEKGKGSKLK